ncbi:MAG: type II CRISPR-associated endonuclease Cas1 [Candidatus Gastranaerophilales bacterium]|nr:type II CRISPR-associated endonuclease Cas1 [Candidatus Gastranaerophilales bacterium]
MSYHILHITKAGSYISIDRGLLFCEVKATGECYKLPIADIKAVIICTPAVAFSNNAIAALLKNNVVIQHCDKFFQPIGWSVPLARIVKTKVFKNQILQNEEFTQKLWKKIVKQKALNQAAVLDFIGDNSHNLYNLINKPLMNEANIAKQYWHDYFFYLSEPMKREHRNAQSFENACLNYGYAILKTIIYRSILIHGLLPNLGIHHTSNYKTTPLVYDLTEPFRAFIDLYLFYFSKNYSLEFENEEIQEWIKYIPNCLKDYRVKYKDNSYKIIDLIDIYVEEIANAFSDFDTEKMLLPDIKEQYLYKDTQKNREYEE